ncbi:hypothetical protein JZO77_22740 [Enterococcus hulanensis]|uniref:pyocin knob domain-containing protein n=1 Tax=Enterococcus hulanensis TaxID=2559929 RepID=UPI001A8E358C|nr:pyocin knob domain-containing protein [Enterococcus hulanensis]MBO0459559.1 hypothetical protein [Enterococcus hulanensis]
MKVVSCNPGQMEVSPNSFNACTFNIIDKWDPKKHAKTCDTMFYLRDGTGAYVWDCDEWIFLDFSGYTASDWNAKENQQGFIKNKPFEKLGDFFVVSSDGVLSVNITPSDIGAATKKELEDHTKDKNNPHGVTATQVGAYSKTESDGRYPKKEDLTSHVNDKENPHDVTAHQVGALTAEETYANVIYQVLGKDITEITFTLNFKNKKTNSLVENPNKARASANNNLITPTTVLNDYSQERYNSVSEIDKNYMAIWLETANQRAQSLFEFAILEEVIRHLGVDFFELQGLTTLKDQTTFLRNKMTNIQSDIWGKGVSQKGNKFYYTTFDNRGNNWGSLVTNESNTVEKTSLIISQSDLEIYLSDSGNMYFLAYSEPTDGTLATQLYIDYVELSFKLRVSTRDVIESMIAQYHIENPPVLAEEKEYGLVVMKDTKVSDQDWNIFTETGVYSVSQGTGANSPTETTPTWGYLVVYRRATDWIEQAYYCSGTMYRRVMQGTPMTWSTWVKMASQSDLKWSNISDKPFESIGDNLEVVDGKLNASGGIAASQIEVNEGNIPDKYISPKTLAEWENEQLLKRGKQMVLGENRQLESPSDMNFGKFGISDNYKAGTFKDEQPYFTVDEAGDVTVVKAGQYLISGICKRQYKRLVSIWHYISLVHKDVTSGSETQVDLFPLGGSIQNRNKQYGQTVRQCKVGDKIWMSSTSSAGSGNANADALQYLNVDFFTMERLGD